MRLFLHQLRDEVSPHSGRDRKLALGKRRETNNLVEPLQQPAGGRELIGLPLLLSSFCNRALCFELSGCTLRARDAISQ